MRREEESYRIHGDFLSSSRSRLISNVHKHIVFLGSETEDNPRSNPVPDVVNSTVKSFYILKEREL